MLVKTYKSLDFQNTFFSVSLVIIKINTSKKRVFCLAFKKYVSIFLFSNHAEYFLHRKKNHNYAFDYPKSSFETELLYA